MSMLKTNKKSVGILFVLRESHDVDLFIKNMNDSAWIFADVQYDHFLVEYSKK